MGSAMKETRTVLVLDNQTCKWVKREIPKGVEALQEIVGGFIELVPLADERVSLFCNDEGKLKGLKTSAIWIDPESGEWLDQLAGPLFALGPEDEDGEATDASDAMVMILSRFLMPVVHMREVVV